jgi:hypothetical protein
MSLLSPAALLYIEGNSGRHVQTPALSLMSLVMIVNGTTYTLEV